jgi:hypothetical protein
VLIPAERLGACNGDMHRIDRLRLVCSACGARDRQATISNRAVKAEAWLEGLSVSPLGVGRPTS